MYEIVEDEYQQFLYDIEVEGALKFGRYVDESNYEDEYSHNDIEEAQNFFVEKVKNICTRITQENMWCMEVFACL